MDPFALHAVSLIHRASLERGIIHSGERRYILRCRNQGSPERLFSGDAQNQGFQREEQPELAIAGVTGLNFSAQQFFGNPRARFLRRALFRAEFLHQIPEGPLVLINFMVED